MLANTNTFLGKHLPSHEHARRTTPPAASLIRRAARAVVAGLLLGSAGALSGAAVDPASNWPHWRGPLANGIAPKANPPTTWSETENVKWKIKLPGSGSATPIIWGNQIFIQTAINTGKKPEGAEEKKPGAFYSPNAFGQVQPPREGPPPDGQRRRGTGGGGRGGFGRGQAPTETHEFVLMSIDRATGKTQWQQVATQTVPHEGHHRDHGFASHSPITDGKLVFAWFGSRGIHCYDLSGKLQWSKDFGDQRTAAGFGEGGSPALYGDTLIINWDHEGEDFITALDKKTGKEIWKQARDERTTWSTPFVVEHEGKPQIVTAASNKVRSYDLASGKVLWECGGLGSNVIPTPVTGNGLIFVMSGHQQPALMAIRLGRSGDLTGTDAVVWNQTQGTPYVPSPLLLGDSLYFFSRTAGRLSCVDYKTGVPRFEATPIDALNGVYASPVSAANRIYLIGRNGTTVVIKPSDKLEILATNKLEDGIDASPALVGGELFLRGSQHLYCLAEK